MDGELWGGNMWLEGKKGDGEGRREISEVDVESGWKDAKIFGNGRITEKTVLG